MQEIKQAAQVLLSLGTQLSPLGDMLENAGLSDGVVNSNASILDRFSLRDQRVGIQRVWAEGMCVVSAAPGGSPILWSGAGVELYEDGQIYLVAAHLIKTDSGDPVTVAEQGKPEEIWHEGRVFPLGSALQETAVEELVAGLMRSVPAAVHRYAELVEKPPRPESS